MSPQIYTIIICNTKSWIKCFNTVMIGLILIFNLIVLSAYNIDTDYAILYPESASNADDYLQTKFEDSYFGYSVSLHYNLQNNTTWLLIGAPRGNYTQSLSNELMQVNEPGVVYQCTFLGACVEIEPSVIQNERIYIDQLDMFVQINKENSWFGSAMSIERNSGIFTICAPRTVMYIISDYQYVDTMQGICYTGDMPSTKLNAEMDTIKSYDYRIKYWYNPLHGFSINFPSLQDKKNVSRVIGDPAHKMSGSIDVLDLKKNNLKSHRIHINLSGQDEDLIEFGYSVTSGCYFNKTKLLYAGGAPGWEYIGQVAVVDIYKDPPAVAKLHGNDIGEFFGASLASGDLNKDGLHDLLVGAPHWQNDNGKVYIYLGSQKGEFEAVTVLEGASEDGQFGYAIMCGDLDGDGFSDIIVSAPWEESGAIYIYNGDANLRDKVRPPVSQKITVQLFNFNLPSKRMNLQTFGFSISEAIDIDNNGYADIAVGAYKSGHVVILRSKPVVKTILTIHTIPNLLSPNSDHFAIRICVEYRDYDEASKHGFKISLIIDMRYKRTKKTSLELFSMNPPIDMCVETNITLLDNIQDFIEPITIYALHDFIYTNSPGRDFCKTCPVESKNNASKSAHTLLPFDIGCGEDRICNSNISAIVKLKGVSDNNTWIINSNDIILEIYLENHAEPAYLTTIACILPNGIILRSILPSCEENMGGNSLVVICNVGNPLGTNKQKVIKLDLDMRHLIDGSLHGKVLEFSIEIQTRSVNHGTNLIISPVTLQSEAALLLNGKATEKIYYLSNSNKENWNVSFQHTYQILKFGATPIQEARLTVKIPTAINGSNSLVFLYKPRLYISGEYYDCSSNGINIINVHENEFQGSTMSQEFSLNAHVTDNRTVNNATRLLRKRDIDNPTITTSIMQTLYNIRIAEPEDLNHNLTRQESDIIYLNCSTNNVNCSTVYCNLNALKTSQDVGKLVIKLILNLTKFKDNDGLLDDTKIIRFNTEAYAQIIQPAKTISDINRHNINLTTEFHSIPRMQKIQLWILITSVSLGLILLFIFIVFLNMMGFFKRTTNYLLKTNEIAEDTSKIDITNKESE